jgi:hypothetical protein
VAAGGARGQQGSRDGAREAAGDVRGRRQCTSPAGSRAREGLTATGKARGGGRGQQGRETARVQRGHAGMWPSLPRPSVKNWEATSIFSCKSSEPLNVLGRWIKGRMLRCDLPLVSY